MYKPEAEPEQAETVDQLKEGELWIHLGCFACPRSVDLVAAAEVHEVTGIAEQAGISYQLRGKNSLGNSASWKVTKVACQPEDCPNVEGIEEVHQTLLELVEGRE